LVYFSAMKGAGPMAAAVSGGRCSVTCGDTSSVHGVTSSESMAV